MEEFFEFEINDNTTVGQLLESWLDITLSVSEDDCLHLAVYTPFDPTDPEVVRS